MTKISTIYDAVRTALASKLTGKTEIPNPYSLSDNPIQFLKNGYGVVIGDGSPASFQVYCLDAEARTFTVILTREVYRLEVDNTNLIAESKNLLEDIRTVKDDFLAHDQIASTDKIQKIDYTGGSGINFVSAGKHNLIYADISFSIEYTETIKNT